MQNPTLSCIVSADTRFEVDQIAAERGWTRSHTAAWLIQQALERVRSEQPTYHEVQVPA